ncbi:hypothetical protein GCM10027040_10990 [Halomonas shantousis]
MSDFDNLARKLARARAKYGPLADRIIKGESKALDELVEALQAYADADDAGQAADEKPSPNLDQTIAQYRDTKAAMEAIIDRHMTTAFKEIEQAFGDTPTRVDLNVTERQTMDDKYPSGKYAGSRVRLGGE